MISRASLARNGQRALRLHARWNASRCLATTARRIEHRKSRSPRAYITFSDCRESRHTIPTIAGLFGRPGKILIQGSSCEVMTAQLMLNRLRLFLKISKADCHVRCCIEHLETIRPKNNEGNRTTRRGIQLLSLKRESCHRCQIPTR